MIADVCECGHDDEDHDNLMGCLGPPNGRYCRCTDFKAPATESVPPRRPVDSIPTPRLVLELVTRARGDAAHRSRDGARHA